MSPDPSVPVFGIAELIRWLRRVPLQRIGTLLARLDRIKVSLAVVVVFVVIVLLGVAGYSAFSSATSTPVAGGAGVDPGVDLTGFCSPALAPSPGGNACHAQIPQTDLDRACRSEYGVPLTFQLTEPGNADSGACFDPKNPSQPARGLGNLTAVCISRFGPGYAFTPDGGLLTCTKKVDYDAACIWKYKVPNLEARFVNGNLLCYERHY